MSLTISVIIPSFNRKKVLANLITAIQAQTLANEYYEIFIVNDGSTDGTSEFLDTRNIPYITTANLGPGCARNTGVRHTKAPVLAFIDDDALPGENWLNSIFQAFMQGKLTCCAEGDVLSTGEDIPLSHSVSHKGPGSYLSCNFAITRKCFKKLRGFNERFRYINEDFEFFLRLNKHYNTIYLPDMVVFHPTVPSPFLKTLTNSLIYAKRYFYAEHLLMELNPEGYQKVKFCKTPEETLKRFSHRYVLSYGFKKIHYFPKHPIRTMMWLIVCLTRQACFNYLRLTGYKG
ncbi:MAG: glycosyltransferase family 2 protein [Fibrobacteria bacterium]|nr:glycosyltransferase family 2 protein [Fibrobacteria bacterium]